MRLDDYNGPYCHECGVITRQCGGHPLGADIRMTKYWMCDDHGVVFHEHGNLGLSFRRIGPEVGGWHFDWDKKVMSWQGPAPESNAEAYRLLLEALPTRGRPHE